MARSPWLCAAVALVVLACATWEARAAVISIDFGGEWIKAALVKVSEEGRGGRVDAVLVAFL